MKRRAVLAAPGLALWSTAPWARTDARPHRIAFFASGSAPRAGHFSTFDAIVAGVRKRGYAALQTRVGYCESRADALPALARQVLAWQPALIITCLTPAALAAQRATRDIPILMAGAGDPVATGLVQSLARPGGNVSGVAALGPELAARSLLPGRPAADLALQHGWRSGSLARSFAEQGGLLAYANDLAQITRLVIDMADRVFRGAALADLPVQQNTRFDLLINLRTAAALGIKAHEIVRSRATELIQ